VNTVFFLFTSSDHLFLKHWTIYSCSKHWISIFKQVTRCENQAGSWRPWTDGTVRQYRPTQIFICCEDCRELEQVARESENSWDWGVLQEKAQRETRVIIWFWRYSQWKNLVWNHELFLCSSQFGKHEQNCDTQYRTWIQKKVNRSANWEYVNKNTSAKIGQQTGNTEVSYAQTDLPLGYITQKEERLREKMTFPKDSFHRKKKD
jgi:hypothetical protein